MESFFSRYRNALVLIAVLLAQVIGLATQVRRPGQSVSDKGGVLLIRAWVVGAVSLPEGLLHATGHGIRGLWMNYVDLIHVRQQNKSLQSQLDSLRLEEASIAEDARQARRLQAILGFQEKYIYKTVAAQVIGTSGTEQSHVLFIDKGSKDGIAADMAVITPDGIVGKTRDVFDHTSQVLEISDATSGAGVIMTDTRIQGVLRGNSWGQPEIVNLSPDNRIRAGEPVVTSGGDSIYPRGLAVGTVDRVVPQPEGTLVNVLIRPAANLQRLEEVLIITSTGDQMPAAMQTDLSDAQQRASDILAERLPSREDPNAPQTNAAGQNGQNPAGQSSPTANGPDRSLPTPPPQPPPPVHPDQYSTSAVLPAEDMVPGQSAAAPSASSVPSAPATTGSAPASGAPAHPAKKKPVPPSATTPSESTPSVSKPAAQPKPAPPQPSRPQSTQPPAPQGRT
ncbi:MAG TPA: rod shape-determining protein MreC [Acidobacteriaceae bacterium]|nr:rod shape-determining protein MreC [Acidobacteriaceae bacterium]